MRTVRHYFARFNLGGILKIAEPFVLPVLILAFVLGGMYVLAYKRFYFYPYFSIPLILFVVYTAIFNLQNLVYLLAFTTPLAVTLKEMGLTQGPDLSIPTEPLMAGMMVTYLLLNMNRRLSDQRFMSHSISWIVFAQILWMAVTACTSVDFIVSIKYLISRLWFVFSCYIIVQHLFPDRQKVIAVAMTYASALFIVVCYTTVIHAKFNFNDKAADWVVSPFYNDHTAYGAALAMFIPFMVAIMLMKSAGKWLKLYAFVLFCAFVTAIILSFARAGWLSLAVALAVLTTLLLKIKFRTLVITFASLGLLFFVFQTDILMALGRNTTDAEGSFENNIESVSNISTNASNLERLNRWSCAIRMWEDKPVFGWGPGTYMFKYAPYQLSHQLTIISTNFGTNGNAHSEYLGPLAEQGVMGLLLVLALLFTTTSMGYRLCYSLADRDDRVLAMGIFLAVMTYFVHGFFNNFLDTDKLSFPFWSFLAAMVCFDLYYPHKKKISGLVS